MALFSARRATDKDLPALERLCAEAAKAVPLWSLRRDRFNAGAWLTARAPVVVVAEGANPMGFAVALADSVPLAAAKCSEALVYVSAGQRRRGGARAAISELLSVARTMGLWKLIAYSLADDAAAKTLLERVDFRSVGTLVKHVQIEGGWRDVVLHERLVLSARKSVPSIPDM
ncbi:MAG TPA: GNAT family N-acetyltransferase [Polyangiaceae bacterium]